jgi:hypothetical protein
MSARRFKVGKDSQGGFHAAGPLPVEQKRPSAPAEIVVLRESSVVTLAAAGVLDALQVAAAFRFRNEWEALIRLRKPSELFERVDNHAGAALAPSERENAAHQQLRRCRLLLGEHGFGLLVKVCGEGYHVRDLYHSRRDRDTATDILKLHLAALAGLWRIE